MGPCKFPKPYSKPYGVLLGGGETGSFRIGLLAHSYGRIGGLLWLLQPAQHEAEARCLGNQSTLIHVSMGLEFFASCEIQSSNCFACGGMPGGPSFAVPLAHEAQALHELARGLHKIMVPGLGSLQQEAQGRFRV